MAVTVNQRDVPRTPAAPGVDRQQLMTSASNRQASVSLDRYTIEPGARLDLGVASGSLAWFQVLEGTLELRSDNRTDMLSAAHVCFLPPGYHGRLAGGDAGATLLYAEVPDAGRFDTEIAKGTLDLRIVDWKREPVLNSEHDARKRIYLVTPKLFGTRAIKGEMIIYPPGTQAANHHHEGAEHFMFVLGGSGTAWANEEPFPVCEGDLIWYADRERHYLKSDDGAEMRFVEFFVPGTYKTTWAPGAMVCTWSPTGRNIEGGDAARAIAHHRSDAPMPTDV